MANKVGRPLKYKTKEELENAIQDYFIACDTHTKREYVKDIGIVEVPDRKPYTISGLALALGVDRLTLLNYQGRKEFFNTIKEAKTRCENYAEESLWTAKNAAGIIFNLKNNYDCWVDKQEIDQNVNDKRKLEDFLK